jgi:DNA (cytosine-5)-methyltransferase 1
MDNTEAITRHIGLCAGYGGIELGLKRVIRNLRSIALCEVEAFAIANLVAKMEAGYLDAAPVWTDLKTFPYGAFHGCVDILTGGYPCQPFSSAGQRRGEQDPRHLWPYIANGIQILRPKFCFFENVEGHITLGLPDVIEDLAGMGYRTAWGIFSAAEVGAPHQRKRVFILAYRDDGESWKDIEPTKSWSDWLEQSSGDTRGDEQAANGEGSSREAAEGAMAYAECNGDAGSRNELASVGQIGQGRTDSTADSDDALWPSRPGERQFDWEPVRTIEPEMGRDFDGVAGRLDHAKLFESCESRYDELRLLGNGVVPQTAALAFRTLARKLLTSAG